MNLDLTPFFTTKGQATDFTVRLSAIVEAIYHTNFSIEKTAMEMLGIKKSEYLLKLMRDNGISLNSAPEVKKFLETIIASIKKMPVLTMTIAFEPTEKTFKLLNDWFVINLKKQFILELIIDPTILSGAIIKYGGAFLDCSGKPLFEKIIANALTSPDVIQPKTPAVLAQKKKHGIEHFHMGR